ncbi:hypothetical protein F5884DRAFT_253990 [Xylogone sp. PMI_703]|nr:hypothetical protein F5884DRAFT_253990 [Xylogone sp. PMI_703]
MLENATITTNTTATQGWTSAPNDRGTWDILSSCVLTIVLCCWTSVCPNIPARGASRLWILRDKACLACIGLLGPEFLLMLALGQWTSARRSVKKFHDAGYEKWTMTHAFFADMGGFLLGTPEYPDFPLDAEQLYYLVTKKYIEYPDIDKEDIEDKNKSDGLARLISICQAIWFTAASIARPIQGLFLTTFELTAMSFIVVFFAVSYCWLNKPSGITRAIVLKLNMRLDEVLAQAGVDPEEPWKRTPLEFISREEWFCSILWKYYNQILDNIVISPFSIPVTSRPYNRIPSDNFPPTDITAEVLCIPFILLFSSTFICAWDFTFPSNTERILWRAASITCVSFGIVGGGFSALCHYLLFPKISHQEKTSESIKITGRSQRYKLFREYLSHKAAKIRNISPDKDPLLTVPLVVLIPISIINAVYCISRGYLLVEDVIGLRKLPTSAFQTVDWSKYIPHF